MTLLRVLFGGIVLLKAVDLTRLLDVDDGRLGAVLLALWVVAGVAVLTRVWRLGCLAVAGTTALLLTLAPSFYNNHTLLLGVVAFYLGVLETSYAQLAVRLQVTVVYLFTGLAKVSPWYLAGDVLAADTRLPLAGTALAVVAAASVVTELFLAVGLWFARTRPLAVVLGVALHVSIVVTMPTTLLGGIRLLVFSATMLTLYLAFLPRADATGSAPPRRRLGPAVSVPSGERAGR